MNQLHPLAKIADQFLLIHPDDVAYLSNTSFLPFLMCLTVDISTGEISEPMLLDKQFKSNPWEIILNDKEREDGIVKICNRFSQGSIDIHIIIPLALHNIYTKNITKSESES